MWMQGHAGLLRSLLDDEGEGAEDLGPAGDPAVRAHLAFVARALAANAAPSAAAGLDAFAANLADELDAREPAVDAHLRALGEATAFELGLQFGDEAGEDPSVRAMIDRRIRIGAWTRVFLEALDDARPAAKPIRDGVLAWMAERQDDLADTIFSMDRRAKQIEIERGGPDAVATPDAANRIGQAAMLQAHTRFLVEALAHHL